MRGTNRGVSASVALLALAFSPAAPADVTYTMTPTRKAPGDVFDFASITFASPPASSHAAWASSGTGAFGAVVGLRLVSGDGLIDYPFSGGLDVELALASANSSDGSQLDGGDIGAFVYSSLNHAGDRDLFFFNITFSPLAGGDEVSITNRSGMDLDFFGDFIVTPEPPSLLLLALGLLPVLALRRP